MQIVRLCSVLLGIVVLVAAGCGEADPLGRQAISGTVSFDGKPVAEGTIGFAPVNGVTSSGAPIKDGKYSIEQEKGLPAGKYKVSISAPKPGTGGTVDPNALPGDPVKPPEEMIPESWNVNTTQEIEVAAGKTEFNFEIPAK